MFNQIKNIKNYIFDMDGTLINSSDEVLKCLKEAFERCHIEFIQSRLETSIIGPPLNKIIEILSPDLRNEKQIEELVMQFRKIYDYKEDDESYLYDGVEKWLQELKKKGKRLFLATNKPKTPTLRLIKQLDIDIFEDIYTIDKYPDRKLTKQTMIEEIITKYHLEKPHTIMVGDALSDIKAAKYSGIKSVGVLWGYDGNKTELEKQADYILKNLEEKCLK